MHDMTNGLDGMRVMCRAWSLDEATLREKGVACAPTPRVFNTSMQTIWYRWQKRSLSRGMQAHPSGTPHTAQPVTQQDLSF